MMKNRPLAGLMGIMPSWVLESDFRSAMDADGEAKTEQACRAIF